MAFVAVAGTSAAIATSVVLAPHLTGEQQALLSKAHAAFQRAWLATAPAGGGYTISSSSMPASLYSTSWTILLLKQSGAMPDTIDTGSVARFMKEVLARPGDHGVPPLEAVWLALRTLNAIGEPVPDATIDGALPAYLTPGGLYSFDPGGQESWGATSVATRILALAGQRAPAATVDRVLDALVHRPRPASIESLVNDDIPLWEAADNVLADRERTPLRPRLDEVVDYFEAWMNAHADYAGGQILGAVVSLDAIAEQNSSAGPRVNPAVVWASLATPNGGFGSGPGEPVPDPHSTYYAVRLGASLDSPGLAYFAERARPDGWPSDQAQLDRCSTYMGALVNRAAADHNHDRALSATAAMWLRELNGQPEVSSAALCVLALAETLGIPVPGELADAIRSNVATAPTGALSLRLRMLQAVGMSRRQDTESLSQHIPASPPTDIDSYDVCVSYAALAGRKGNCELPGTLEAPDGTYKSLPEAPVSDLRATVIALQSSGDLARRIEALGRFQSAGLTWMLPVEATPNVNNLDAEFLSLVLADVIRAPRYL